MGHRAYYITGGVLSNSNRSLASSSRSSHSDRILHWLDLLDAIYVIGAARYNSPTCSQAINNRCCNTLQRRPDHDIRHDEGHELTKTELIAIDGMT